MGMADAKSGFLEIVSDWNEPDAATEFGMLRRVVEASSRTAVFSLTQRHDRTETWKELLGLAGDAARDGLSIRPVVAPRPIGILLGLEGSQNRSEEHTSELQSLMRNSYAVFCLKKHNNKQKDNSRKQARN